MRIAVPINSGKIITCKIIVIDSVRFMLCSFSILIDNITRGFFKDKCKTCNFDLEYMTVNYGSLVFKCVECK